MYLKKRSRLQRLTEGDRNTTSFHRSASKHKKRNTITFLYDSNNNTLTDQEEIGRLVVTYFTEAYVGLNMKCDLIKKIQKKTENKKDATIQ